MLQMCETLLSFEGLGNRVDFKSCARHVVKKESLAGRTSSGSSGIRVPDVAEDAARAAQPRGAEVSRALLLDKTLRDPRWRFPPRNPSFAMLLHSWRVGNIRELSNDGLKMVKQKTKSQNVKYLVVTIETFLLLAFVCFARGIEACPL